MFKAMGIGALAAIATSFLLAAVYGCIFGASEPWGEEQNGTAGALNGVRSLIFMGMAFPPTFPAIALVGALVGLIIRLVRQSFAKQP
ncbi:MAG TPA: hypothetical protein VG122_05030 [Gemmata sp.]|jgi:hypothetical protein|nr:hypothetical protein [Gemmata sp.]